MARAGSIGRKISQYDSDPESRDRQKRPVYRAARLALLQQGLMLSFKDTDAAARKVERAATKLAEVNAAAPN